MDGARGGPQESDEVPHRVARSGADELEVGGPAPPGTEEYPLALDEPPSFNPSSAIITFLKGMWPRRIQPQHCAGLGTAWASADRCIDEFYRVLL